MVNTDITILTAQDNTAAKKIKSIRCKLRGIINFIATAFFVIWQIAFIVVSIFGVMPYLLPELWISYKHYDMPFYYFSLSVILVTLPLVCLGVIIWLATGKKQNRNKLLLKFFYGFELPTLILLVLYLVNLRDYGAGMYWVTICMVIALATWCFMVFYQRAKNTTDSVLFANRPIATAGSTIMFAVGLFVSITALLFAIPLAMFVLKRAMMALNEIDSMVFSQIWHEITTINLKALLSTILATPFVLVMGAMAVLAFASMAFLIVFPFVLAYLYIGQFITRFKQSATFANAALALVLIVVLTGVHFSINQQPQVKAFALLETPPTTIDERKALVEHSELIRDGLVNAYLARYRYFSSTESAQILTAMYADAFSVDSIAVTYPQQILNLFLQPILYQGDNRADPQIAAKLYEEYFDAPIQKAELDEIWRTLKHNHLSSRQNAAGLLDVSEKSVYLEKRTINITTEQEIATVRITQKMVNKELGHREAVMHFSLPQHAVITGVWLSNNETDLEQHEPLVAPRGAAQMVYNQQVSRRIDPALLEKVGPELYRLRVYPITSATRSDRNITDGSPMYVTMEYQALANSNGKWPIPTLLEKRNLYWDQNTVDMFNDSVFDSAHDNSWLPLNENQLSKSGPLLDTIELDVNNSRASKWAQARTSFEANASVNPPTLSNTAVLLDGSYSMQAMAATVAKALPQLAGASFYLCQETCLISNIEELTQAVYYGNSKPIEQVDAFLAQLANNQAGNINSQTIDRIIVLTDNGSYEAESNEQAVVSSPAPIWVLHIGGSQPYAYSDAWLTTVNQSGGGFATTGVSEFLNTLTLHNNAAKLALRSIGTDWIWFNKLTDTITDTTNSKASPYAKLDAAIQITKASKSGKALALQDLDGLHLQAIKARIVTELSSMIVLVNEQQKNALKQASKEDDRFDRENEDGTQIVGVPGDTLSVAAVPEPREWALILMALLLAFYSLYQRRHTLYLAGLWQKPEKSRRDLGFMSSASCREA